MGYISKENDELRVSLLLFGLLNLYSSGFFQVNRVTYIISLDYAK